MYGFSPPSPRFIYRWPNNIPNWGIQTFIYNHQYLFYCIQLLDDCVNLMASLLKFHFQLFFRSYKKRLLKYCKVFLKYDICMIKWWNDWFMNSLVGIIAIFFLKFMLYFHGYFIRFFSIVLANKIWRIFKEHFLNFIFNSIKSKM